MWHRVDVVLTDVSEERIASIYRVEGKIFQHQSAGTGSHGIFACGFSYFFSTLKMEVICFSETSV
jgi:hypothetical protein